MNETVFFFRTSLVSLSMAGIFCYDTVHVKKGVEILGLGTKWSISRLHGIEPTLVQHQKDCLRAIIRYKIYPARAILKCLVLQGQPCVISELTR